MCIENLIQCSKNLKKSFEKNYFEEVIDNGNIFSTINYALKLSENNVNDEIIVIIGSLYMMREVIQFFGFKDECDPF